MLQIGNSSDEDASALEDVEIVETKATSTSKLFLCILVRMSK